MSIINQNTYNNPNIQLSAHKQSQSNKQCLKTLTKHLSKHQQEQIRSLPENLLSDFSGSEHELVACLAVIFDESKPIVAKLYAFQSMVKQTKTQGTLIFESELDPEWARKNTRLVATNMVPRNLNQAESFRKNDYSEVNYQVILIFYQVAINIGNISVKDYRNFRIHNFIGSEIEAGAGYFGAKLSKENHVQTTRKEQSEPKLQLFQAIKFNQPV